MRSVLLLALSSSALADFLGPRVPFPRDLSSNSSRVTSQWRNLTSTLNEILSSDDSSLSSLKNVTFSLGVFSPHDAEAATNPAVQYHYTSPEVAISPYGVNKVDGDSVYRVASITKMITVLTGLLNLKSSDWDRPLTDFFPELATTAGTADGVQNIQWDKISVMALASQIGGVPRDAFGAGSDLNLTPESSAAAVAAGLPPLTPEDPLWSSTCMHSPDIACFADFNNYIKGIQQRPPTFSPWASPGYSNNGYILLGQIFKNITGKDIEQLYRESVFDPLGMTKSSAVTPPEHLWPAYVIPEAALAIGTMNDTGLEATRSSGGVFSSLHELAKLGVAVLDNTLLSREETNKWMKPHTHTDRLQVSIGAPWEIFRYTHADNGVVTDMYCKSGDSGAYSSLMCFLPDFEAGFTILSSSSARERTRIVGQIADLIVDSLMPGLMEQAILEANQKLAGEYESTVEGLNSSITISVNTTKGAPPGLTISSFISNGTDVLSEEVGILPSTRLTPTISSDGCRQAFRAVSAADIPSRPLGRFSDLLAFSWVTAGVSSYGNVDTSLFYFDIDDSGRATAPSLLPETDGLELRSLAFFREVVAPNLSGTLDTSFWTRLVAQITHQEPAAKHAVVAISTLYEEFDRGTDHLVLQKRHDFALQQYNRAIKHALASTNAEAMLHLSVLFICIELLRGNSAAAISHLAHGVNLLIGSKQDERALSAIYQHLSILPFFFSDGPMPPLPVLPCKSHKSFDNIYEAQVAMDWLCSRTIRLIRAADHYRLGAAPTPVPELLLEEQQQLLSDMDSYNTTAGIFWSDRQDEDINYLLVKIKGIICQIWASNCFAHDETIYDDYFASFNEIIRLAERARAAQDRSEKRRSGFTFQMGFSPLLHFVVLKCRRLDLRLAALALQEQMSYSREVLWDAAILSAIGKRVIEIEHGIENVFIEGENMVGSILPSDEQRIKDSVLEEETEIITNGEGKRMTVKQAISYTKMRFLNFCFVSAAAAAAFRQSIPTITQVGVLAARETGPSAPTAAPVGTFTTTKYITVPGVTNDHVTIPAKTIELTLPTCIQSVLPDENGHIPPGNCGAKWAYYPSFAAALAFLGAFGGLLILHIWQAAKHKKPWCWVIIMATVWEVLAFLFRAISSKNQQSDGILLMFQIFILLAPLWINAFAYMTLGRMIHFFHPSQSLLGLKAPTIAALFVVLDILSFIVQLVGGGSAGPSSPPEQQRRGLNIYMAGISVQEVFVVIFMLLCIAFQQQMISRTADTGRLGGFVGTRWGPLLGMLLLSLTLITIRIIYRLVEFSGGLAHESPLRTQEAYFYALEAVPMFIAILVFNIVHPGRVINGPGSEMPGIFSLVRNKFRRRKGHKILSDEGSEEDIFALKNRV
ncbi:putative lipid transporter atnI [Paramyrothecium foliicola]|nr:putative lipid transporter atnI [Paramyrothecium foliicola]